MRYELSDFEWTAIKPMLPNKPRGVRRTNDRRVASFGFCALMHHGELPAPHRLRMVASPVHDNR
jgi:transposase